MKYTYGNGLVGGAFRVYASNLSWREYAADGGVVAQSPTIPGFTGEFPAEYDHTDDCKRLRPAPYANVYIRFGELPKSGKSRNWATGQDEAGVSAYEARWDVISQCYVPYGALEGAEIAYRLQGAAAYLISGETNGRGSDGEPTVKDAKIIAELTPVENGYRI